MPRLNWKIIAMDVAEAREQLEEIEQRLENGGRMSAIEFQIMMQHVYRHLNFAWNARHQTLKRYENLTDEEFQEWSKMPTDIEFIFKG